MAFDSWSSNVSGDLFEKLRNFCEMTGKITEEQFTQAYVHGCGKEAPFHLKKNVFGLQKATKQTLSLQKQLLQQK